MDVPDRVPLNVTISSDQPIFGRLQTVAVLPSRDRGVSHVCHHGHVDLVHASGHGAGGHCVRAQSGQVRQHVADRAAGVHPGDADLDGLLHAHHPAQRRALRARIPADLRPEEAPRAPPRLRQHPRQAEGVRHHDLPALDGHILLVPVPAHGSARSVHIGQGEPLLVEGTERRDLGSSVRELPD